MKRELRRSHDLRAGIRRYLNSTSERKKMSTKTLRKRIALVAVAALGAGILSVAPASADSFGETIGATSVYSNQVCAETSSTTAVIPVGSFLVLDQEGYSYSEEDEDYTYAILSGPVAITNWAGNDSGGPGINASGKKTFESDFGFEDYSQATLTATAVGTIAITAGDYNDNASATSSNTMYFTVVAACTTGTYSASKSHASVTDDYEDNWYGEGTNIDDTTLSTDGASLYVRVDARNAYDGLLPDGVVGVTATNGALVSVGDDAEAQPSKGLLSIAAVPQDGDFMVRVAPKTAGVPQTSVVTITYNGVAVATKNLTFYGEATKLNVVGGVTGTNGGTGYITYTLTDASGNKVPGSVDFDQSTATARIQNGYNDSSAGLGTNSLLGTTLPAGVGIFAYDCTASQGSGSNSIGFSHESSVNGNELTATATAVCAGGINTFTVSTDKATYKVGDIATITITAKDSSGAAVSDQTTLGTGALISAGGMTQVGSTSISSNTFTAGTKSYTFQVTAGGAFNVVATLPAGTTTKSATSGYTVASGDVQMSEVLKAIVSLIASINKQIAALQKALVKKK